MWLIVLIDSRISHQGAMPILAFCQLTPIPLLVNDLLQVSMKRSQQRWCERGCDRVVLLRAACKRGKFHLISDLFQRENYRLTA